MAHFLIWLSLGFLLYVHLGYPLVLYVWRKVAARPVKKVFCEPTVSILIAAHNERDSIEKKLLNCLQLDYPLAKLQVVVALDAPTDGTDAIVAGYVARYENETVNVVALPQRKGKAG